MSKKTLKDALERAELNPVGTIADDARNANLAVIKAALVPPRQAVTPEMVETMAYEGLSSSVICGILGVQYSYITDRPELLAAFAKGRSTIGSKIRASLIEDALENNLLPAKIYLDKIYGGDVEQKNIAVTVTQPPLENIPTEQLLEFDDGEDSSN